MAGSRVEVAIVGFNGHVDETIGENSDRLQIVSLTALQLAWPVSKRWKVFSESPNHAVFFNTEIGRVLKVSVKLDYRRARLDGMERFVPALLVRQSARTDGRFQSMLRSCLAVIDCLEW